MMDPEVKRAIRDEIRLQLNVILNAAAGADNDSQSETISTLFPGSPDITGRPVMHPFGFVSRATTGTISVVAKVGADMQNRMTLGHRDSKRPSVEQGECALYSIGGYQVRVQEGVLLIGKNGEFEPMIMGTTAVEFFISLIQIILAHTHEGNLGAETSPMLNAEDLVNLQSENLDNNFILAEDGGRF